MIKLTTNTEGKIETVEFNGKPLKGADMRGIKAAQKKPYWKLYSQPATVTNPFSGVSVELQPFELSVYKFCMNWYRNYSAGNETSPQVYDDMRYLLNHLNPSAYMDLLD